MQLIAIASTSQVEGGEFDVRERPQNVGYLIWIKRHLLYI